MHGSVDLVQNYQRACPHYQHASHCLHQKQQQLHEVQPCCPLPSVVVARTSGLQPSGQSADPVQHSPPSSAPSQGPEWQSGWRLHARRRSLTRHERLSDRRTPAPSAGWTRPVCTRGRQRDRQRDGTVADDLVRTQGAAQSYGNHHASRVPQV